MSDLRDFLKLSVLPEPRSRLIILLFLIFFRVLWRSGLRLFVGCMVRTARGGNSFAGEVWIRHCRFLGDGFVIAEVDQLHFKLSTDTEDHRFVGSSSEWLVDAVTRQLVTEGLSDDSAEVSRILRKQQSWASHLLTQTVNHNCLTEVWLDRSRCP